MKKHLVAFILCLICFTALQAQSGTSGKKTEYTTFMTLQPGEKVMALYSCMWLNGNKELYRLVIQHGGNYSMITPEGRKDNLTLNDVLGYSNTSRCTEKDPYYQKSTRYKGAKLVKYNAKGKPTIVSRKKTFGPYEEIIYIEERGEKFVAVVRVVKNGKQEIWYVDAEGKQYKLANRPVEMITNVDLTKVALVMPPAEAVPMDVVNAWPQEKKTEYFQKLSKKEQSLWFNNDSTASLTRQYRRLEFDLSGRHFMAVYTSYFVIGGKSVTANISGAGTRVFAGKNPLNWAAYANGYLNFSDKTSIKDAINPFFTTEDGKDYVNWFKVESGRNGDIIKWCKKEI